MKRHCCSVPFLFAVVLFSTAACDNLRPSTPTPTLRQHLRTYVLLGEAGTGKSTVGNALLNQRGDVESVQREPFATSDDAEATTRHLQSAVNMDTGLLVIDTPSVSALLAEPQAFVRDLVAELAKHGQTHIDALLFVTDRGQPLDRSWRVLQQAQACLLTHARGGGVVSMRRSTALLVNKCVQGWLAKKRQQENERLGHMLDACDRVSYELDLKWDHSSDDNETRANNSLIREASARQLGAFFASRHFDPFNISQALDDGAGGGGTQQLLNFISRNLASPIYYIGNMLSGEQHKSRHRKPAPFVHSGAYIGGVFAPLWRRIYLMPYEQSDQADWHYIDYSASIVPSANRTPSVIAYPHEQGKTALVPGAYIAGVLAPVQQRIYLVPHNQARESTWHYIDCRTDGRVVAYSHQLQHENTIFVHGAYENGVYEPEHQRIYLVPANQASQPYWHYINCQTGKVVTYRHYMYGLSTKHAYAGGVYCPMRKRVYFVPSGQAIKEEWHFVECQTGLVVPYRHNLMAWSEVVDGAYVGGVYDHHKQRIYLVPSAQATRHHWHYIDCESGNVVAYEHMAGESVVHRAYQGGVYSPEQKRIYLMPFNQCEEPVWHYIDCESGRVVGYRHGLYAPQANTRFMKPTLVELAYNGGVHAPSQERIYLVPFNQAEHDEWHYIDCSSPASSKNVTVVAYKVDVKVA